MSAALAAEDSLARRILRKCTAELALALSHVVHLLHPQVIVSAAGWRLLGEPLRAAIAEALPRFIMDAFQPGPRVALAALREDAVPVGALAFAAQHLAAMESK